MRIKISLILITTIFVISCKQQNSYLSDEQVYEAQKKVLLKGDKKSYSMLSLYYEDKQSNSMILPYSILMAHRFNDKDAYYDVYQATICVFNNNEFNSDLIEKLDSESKDFALKHLLKSDELGNEHAKEVLEQYTKKGFLIQKGEGNKELK
ncbi:hypothetical protein NAT51_08035 [Flavobacterium amniphilum]|uniref:hypothetical protein n=1 Tax=Flavobacterium amniphilum TaxID=1834035 RepID=UPI002029EFE3|nr:hypothetical protein [Flavobacterium amniphilum]MCL9805467.1 hypothetical protein [Flavobacterium amniphilum]